MVSDFFPPTPGGMEAHVRRLAEALIDGGNEIAVLTGTAHPDRLPGLPTVESASTMLSRTPRIFADKALQYPPPFPDPVLGKAVRRLVDSWHPDVIHAHGWCAFSSHWPGSPPLIITLHDHALRCPKRTLLRGTAECSTGRGIRCVSCAGDQSVIRRTALAAAMSRSVSDLAKHTDRFIAVSHSIAQRAAEIGISGSKVQVIPNFLDPKTMVPGADPEHRTILFVGPDSPHKGRSVAIEAFCRLPPGTAQLLLVGGGAPVNIEGISSLGYLRGPALWQQYRRASVVVVPSIWPEPSPTVALEAMAHGLPVIGSRIGGIPDLVEHERSGLLVPPNDASRLADSMHTLLTDHDLRNRLSDGARVRILNFDTATIVPQIVRVYESLLRTRVGS